MAAAEAETPLKIHGTPASTCTSRVLTAAIEAGAPFQIVPVNLSTGDHKKPHFLALQPFGVIPVLEDDGLHIFESRAIIRYIANKYEKGGDLYGKTLADKAKVEQWLEVESQNYNPPISAVVAQIVFKPRFQGAPPDEKVVEENLSKLEKVLDIYDAHLAKHDYLAGDFFSLADLSHLPYTHYLINIAQKGHVITTRKHVLAWWERISSRPSWKHVLELAAPPKSD